MFHSLVSLILLVNLRRIYSIEEDNLAKALNSIENRQRQLVSHYYTLPNKDSEKTFQHDDDSLMYLDNPPSYYDTSHYDSFALGKPAKIVPSYDEESYISDLETKEYQKALNERLLDQLALDLLRSDEELLSHRTQKKSFFREREMNDLPDNLQNFQPEVNFDETFVSRLRSKPHSPDRHFNLEDVDDGHSNTIDPVWADFESRSSLDRDSEAMDRDVVNALMKYLVRTSESSNDEDDDSDNDDADDDDDYYTRETYTSENRNHDRDRSKRYWLGSSQPSQIRKRSTNVSEKFQSSSSETTKIQKENTTSSNRNATEKPKNEVKRQKKGQKEIPVDLHSLKPLNIKKKSIDWSNYFGVDKRQKKSSTKTPPKGTPKSDVLLDQYIQSYILQSVRDSAFNNRASDYNRYPKRNIFREQRLEETNKQLETAEDLKTAEDMIIEHVLKYTGAHQGTTDPKALHRYRERILNELGAAYNLEKLRSEISSKNEQLVSQKQRQHTNDKRVAVKKENVELLPLEVVALNMKRNESKMTDKNLDNIYSTVTTWERGHRQCPMSDQVISRCLVHLKDDKSYPYDHDFLSQCVYFSVCDICNDAKKNVVRDSMDCSLDVAQKIDLICFRQASRKHCLNKGRRLMEVLRSREAQTFFARSHCESCIDIFSRTF